MMILKHFFNAIFFLNVIFQDFVLADNEECSCVYLELEEIKTCKDWESAPVKFNAKLEVNDEHGSLSGKIIANTEINEGVEVSIVIMLETPNGEELVYSAGSDLCQSLKDKDAPWAPIMASFNTTRCPIYKGEYEVLDVNISLGSVKGFMTTDFVGTYSILVSVELAVAKIMCFMLGAEIIEEKRLCSECPNPQNEKKNHNNLQPEHKLISIL